MSEILRAMNAALYLGAHVGDAFAQATPNIPMISFGSGSIDESNTIASNGQIEDQASHIVKLRKWTEVVAWVRQWDQSH